MLNGICVVKRAWAKGLILWIPWPSQLIFFAVFYFLYIQKELYVSITCCAMWLNRIWTSLQDAISVCLCCLCQSHLQKGLHNIMSQGAPGPHLPIRAATPSPLHHLLLLYIFLWDVLQVKSVLLAENRNWRILFMQDTRGLSKSFPKLPATTDPPWHSSPQIL